MSKIRKCSACNGTGYYDNTGSPKCGCCNGIGYMRNSMPYRLWKRILVKYYDVYKSKIEEVYEMWRCL